MERDSEGRGVLVRGCILDGSDRKKAEESLREAHEQTQAILDNTPLLIFVKDLEGRIILCNRSFESLFGLPRSELLGKTSHDLLPKEIADAHRANDLEIMQKQSAAFSEEVTEGGEGRQIYLTVKFPLFDTAGQMNGVCGISNDITERKKAEDEIRRRAEELSALNSLGRAVSLLSLEAVVSASVQETLRAAQPDLVFVFLSKGDEMELAGYGSLSQDWTIDESRIPFVGEGVCGLALRQREAIYSEERLREAKRYSRSKMILRF